MPPFFSHFILLLPLPFGILVCRLDMDAKTMKSRSQFRRLEIVGTHKSSGSIMVVKVSGEGRFNITAGMKNVYSYFFTSFFAIYLSFLFFLLSFFWCSYLSFSPLVRHRSENATSNFLMQPSTVGVAHWKIITFCYRRRGAIEESRRIQNSDNAGKSVKIVQ